MDGLRGARPDGIACSRRASRALQPRWPSSWCVPLLAGRVEAPTLDRDLAEKLLVGAGQGLVYGGVVEPRIPGPSVLKGALYGSAEYAVDPMGGLAHLLGGRAPQGSLPVVADLLEGLDAHDRAYVEHVVFGIAVALLYGSSPSSNGIRVELDDDE